MSRGRIPCFSRFITTSPQRKATSSFCGSIAGMLLKPMGERPIIPSRSTWCWRCTARRRRRRRGRQHFPDRAIPRRHFSGGVRADGFKDILNGDVFALVIARGDGAAVEHEARKIQSRQRHGGGREWSCRNPPRKPRRRTSARGKPVRWNRRSLRGSPAKPACLRCPWFRRRRWRWY